MIGEVTPKIKLQKSRTGFVQDPRFENWLDTLLRPEGE